MIYSTRTKRLIIGIFIAFFSLASLSLCSKLSPLVFSAQNPDPMSFFMSAKAWANGLLPYRDTVDYKGPLLYLIYMAGYLISPRSTCGVFLIQSLFMGVTLSLLYRVARLFLHGRRSSLLAVVLALPFFLSPAYHLDGRAEELALPFLALLMYTSCRVLKTAFNTGGGYMKAT